MLECGIIIASSLMTVATESGGIGLCRAGTLHRRFPIVRMLDDFETSVNPCLEVYTGIDRFSLCRANGVEQFPRTRGDSSPDAN